MKKVFFVLLSAFLFSNIPVNFVSAQVSSSSYSYSSVNSSVSSASSSAYASGDQSSASATACSNNTCISSSQSQNETSSSGVSASADTQGEQDISQSTQAFPKETSKPQSKPETIAKTAEPAAETESTEKQENKIPQVTIADSQKTKINVLPSVTVPPQVSADNIKKLPALENNWKGVGIIALIALILGILVYFGSNFFFRKESVSQQDLFSYKPDENLEGFRVEEKDSEVQDSSPPENKEDRW